MVPGRGFFKLGIMNIPLTFGHWRNLGSLNKMKPAKNGLVSMFRSFAYSDDYPIISIRKQFHDQVITSTHDLFLSELNSIAQDNFATSRSRFDPS